jgi:hypothetical protein
MPSTLRFIPEKSGYSSEEMPGTIVVPVEGGGSRKRQDILLTGHVVNCQWLLDAEEYTEFMGFFDTELFYGREDFLMDLITDIGVPTAHVCRTVGGNPKLTQQKNNAYWVSGTLECDKNPTFTSTITYTVGEGGEFWVFDGSNDFVEIGNFAEYQFERTDSFSISGWFSSTDVNAGRIVSKATNTTPVRGWVVFLSSGTTPGASQGALAFRISNAAGDPFDNQLQVDTGGVTFNDGQEHHFLITYDGSNTPAGVKIYVDNVLQVPNTGFNTLTGTILNSDPLTISDTVSSYSGNLRHIAVWDSELSSSDKADLYNDGVPPDLLTVSATSSLVGWWKLDEDDSIGAGGIVDYSPSSRDGTAQNGLAPTGGALVGQIIFTGIGKHFQEGDKVRIINSSGIHPDGDIPLNLDGIYDVLETIVGNAILIDAPSVSNSDWSTLFDIDPINLAEYGNLANGNVLSTVTKVPQP